MYSFVIKLTKFTTFHQDWKLAKKMAEFFNDVYVGKRFYVACILNCCIAQEVWCEAVITGFTDCMVEYRRVCPQGSYTGFAYGAMVRDDFLLHVIAQSPRQQT